MSAATLYVMFHVVWAGAVVLFISEEISNIGIIRQSVSKVIRFDRALLLKASMCQEGAKSGLKSQSYLTSVCPSQLASFIHVASFKVY